MCGAVVWWWADREDEDDGLVDLLAQLLALVVLRATAQWAANQETSVCIWQTADTGCTVCVRVR